MNTVLKYQLKSHFLIWSEIRTKMISFNIVYCKNWHPMKCECFTESKKCLRRLNLSLVHLTSEWSEKNVFFQDIKAKKMTSEMLVKTKKKTKKKSANGEWRMLFSLRKVSPKSLSSHCPSLSYCQSLNTSRCVHLISWTTLSFSWGP